DDSRFNEPNWTYGRAQTRERSRRLYEEERPRRALPFPEEETSDESSFKLPFDIFRILDALKEKWKWWLGAAFALGLAGFLAGFLGTNYIVSLQLMRREIPVAFRASENGDSFKPQFFSESTLMDLLKAPEVLRRVSAQSNPKISPGKLSLGLTA